MTEEGEIVTAEKSLAAVAADDYYEELDDSDTKPPPKTSYTHLDWRLDPVISHSDWTIQIVVKDNQNVSKVQEYHVHRCILTVGARKSGYFERICRTDSEFQEGSTQTSRIELEQIAADAIPVMLDYLYDKDFSLVFIATTRLATALHYLALYFD
jgi:hypothetical protein